MQVHYSVTVVMTCWLCDSTYDVSVVHSVVRDVQVRYSVIENSESCININFENVPVSKLHDIRPR